MLTTHGSFGAEAGKPIACTVQVDSVLHDRFPAEKLFDGQTVDPNSRWASSRAGVPHWVTIEWDQPVVLDRLVVYGHDTSKGLALADAAVQTRDGGGWKTLAAVRDNQKAQVEFFWPTVEMSAIRLLITRACQADHTARLFELVLYHRDTPIQLEVKAHDGSLEHIDDERLLTSVVPLAMEPTEAGPLLQQYYDSTLAWSRLLGERFQAVPDHADWGYYGDGRHTEDTVRPICYAALTNAFLAEIEPPGACASQLQRDEMRRRATAALRYLTHSHQSNGGVCLNGRPWGNQWQSAMWARSLGLAGWLLWDRLDHSDRLAVARVVEYEADRFVGVNPKSSLNNDTGAEENAWNAGLIAMARCMMPNHPRAAEWDMAAKRYMYNTFSVVADANDASIGDDGRPVCDWVTTVNAHPDYTVENHGLVHVGYLKNAHALLLEAASPYCLTGRSMPLAGRHHADDVFEVLLKCIADEGAPIYFGGNDWKLVHTQCSDVISFALTNTMSGDPRAAHLESVALEWLCRIQEQRGGFYTVRKDLEHNGFVASRLVTCYLMHAQTSGCVKPVSAEQFQQSISGVTRLEHGQAILHRTPGKFVSFAWGRNRMALAMPRGGNWVVWPHFASYLGLINGEDSSQKQAVLANLHESVYPNRFTVTGTLQRCDGQVEHDFSITSLEKDIVVYIERLRVRDGFRMESRETGIVGHEYPLESNTRTVFGPFGRQELVGLGNPSAIRELKADWLNLGGQIGYVVRRHPQRQNVIRYHDQTDGAGRVPKLQEWFSLVGEVRDDIGGDDWACVVTFLNQLPDETAAWAQRVRFEVNGHTAVCHLDEDVVRVNFSFPLSGP